MNRFGSTLQTTWDWRAAGNFMFGGTGGALVFMAAVASYPNSPTQPLGMIALTLVEPKPVDQDGRGERVRLIQGQEHLDFQRVKLRRRNGL